MTIGAHGEHLLIIVTLRTRWDPFLHGDSVWFAGDPNRRGAVSLSGAYMAWARRPRSAWYRHYLHRKVSAALAAAASPAP